MRFSSLILTCSLASVLGTSAQEAAILTETPSLQAEASTPLEEVKEAQPTLEASTDLAEEIETSIRRGVDFLVATQNKTGSWGNPTRTKGLNINAPIPGAHHAFRSGSSALALQGLLLSSDRRPETVKAIEMGEAWLLDQLPRLRRAEQLTIYNNWGHAYGIRVLAELHKYHAGNVSKQAALARLAEEQVGMLYRYEYLNGGWGYYDFVAHTQKPSGTPTSFTTASCLLALNDAQEVFGIELSERVVQRALRCIKDQETPDGCFVYSQPHWRAPRGVINRPAGSLARSQACNVALHAFDYEDITDERIFEWLDRLTKRDGFLSIGRKRPIPHETHFKISGYFYYYGFYYATECLQMLPAEKQKKFIPHLARHIMEKQESNGSWWDYPLYDYHQPYGTGYALTTLSRLRKK